MSCTSAFPPGCWQKCICSCRGFPTHSLSPQFWGPILALENFATTLIWFPGLVGGMGIGPILYRPQSGKHTSRAVMLALHELLGRAWEAVGERQKAQLCSWVLFNRHWLSPSSEPGDATGHLSSSAEQPQVVPGPVSLLCAVRSSHRGQQAPIREESVHSQASASVISFPAWLPETSGGC